VRDIDARDNVVLVHDPRTVVLDNDACDNDLVQLAVVRDIDARDNDRDSRCL
jgi:hypothetical protein